MSPPRAPALRGEVWLADLNPTRGHEQAGKRPVVILSEDLFNRGPAGLVIVVPITSTVRPIPSHVPVEPPDGGLRHGGAILCEAVRSISGERLVERWGRLRPSTMATVADCLRILMRL
jgi:mRNA interferase MazF